MHEFAPSLGCESIYLYLFLAGVSDKSGISYYRESTIQNRIGITPKNIIKAREELLGKDLIAYETPLYQVLSLPIRKEYCPPASSAVMSLGELMTSISLRKERAGAL